jgi:uncharacterized hydrophobic protein (TIGR00271 family)
VNDENSDLNGISFRQSGQFGASRQFLVSLGIWLALGFFTLHDVVVEIVGPSAVWAYLLTSVLLLPTFLSHIELRSWIRPGGSSFRLIRALERNNITFVVGWLYLLGWAAISGMIALAFGQFTSDLLIATLGINVESWLLSGGAVLILTLLLLFGANPIRSFAYLAAIIAFGAILIMLGLMLARIPTAGELSLGSGFGTPRFIEAVGLLVASFWIVETGSTLQGGRSIKPQTRLLYLLLGPLTALLFVLMTTATSGSAQPLNEISALLLGEDGPIALSVVGLIVTLAMLQVLGYVSLRLFQTIGNHGCYAQWVIKRNDFAQTPTGIIVLMGALTLGAIALQDIIMLAQIAALVVLVIQTGVNITAAILARQKRAENRSLTIPLWPIVQASGAAICVLLALILPLNVILIGVGWVLVSTLFFFQFGRTAMRDRQMGITVFQDSAIDLSSKYPVIVPVSNPATASNLVVFGAEAAKNHGGHLLLVQIVVVPEDKELDEARTEAEDRLDVLRQSLREAQTFDVPVEGVTRLARSVHQGILDTITEENASLVVVGWPGDPHAEDGAALGPILEEIVTNSPCDVAIVRGAWTPEIKHVLIPAGGGPHAIAATDLGLALTLDAEGDVTLLNITRPRADAETHQQGRNALQKIRQRFSDTERINAKLSIADSPLEGILTTLDNYDALLIGASGSPFFIDQEIIGKLQLDIVRQTDKPIAVVQGYTGVGNLVMRRTWQSLSDLLPTLSIDEQVDLLERMRSSAVPSINYFVLITLSAMIATFGLLQNSAAVIIGAMLVAPLMSPIVASGIGIVRGDIKTFRNGLVSTLQGMLASVFLAIFLTLFTPIAAATPEVVARTQPTLLDMMVALISGAAGAYAIGRTEVGAALPGVAIAAALMPPICTIGIGIALGRVDYASGATLLFFTNLFSIIVAAALTFLLLGVRPPQSENRQRQLQQGLRVSVLTLAALSLPLGFLLFSQVQQDQFRREAETEIARTISAWGDTDIVDLQIQYRPRTITVQGTIYVSGEFTPTNVEVIEERLEDDTNRNVQLALDVVPVTRLQGTDTGE